MITPYRTSLPDPLDENVSKRWVRKRQAPMSTEPWVETPLARVKRLAREAATRHALEEEYKRDLGEVARERDLKARHAAGKVRIRKKRLDAAQANLAQSTAIPEGAPPGKESLSSRKSLSGSGARHNLIQANSKPNFHSDHRQNL